MFLLIKLQSTEIHLFASQLFFLAEIRSIIGRRSSSCISGIVSSIISLGWGSINSQISNPVWRRLLIYVVKVLWYFTTSSPKNSSTFAFTEVAVYRPVSTFSILVVIPILITIGCEYRMLYWKTKEPPAVRQLLTLRHILIKDSR